VHCRAGFPVHDAFALSDNTFVVAYANSSAKHLACRFGSFSAADKAITFTDATVFDSAHLSFALLHMP
jgi:hypothetical protein